MNEAKKAYLIFGIFIFATGLYGIYFQGDFWGRGVSLGNYNESNIISSLYLPEITIAAGLLSLSLFCFETKHPRRNLIITFSIALILIFIAGYIGGKEAVELIKQQN